MKTLIAITLFALLSVSCDFHFGMEDLNIGACVKEINTTYVAGENTKFTVYKIESKQSSAYTISTWHNRAWLFLKKKPRDYFVDGKIFKYQVVTCPDQAKAKEGMKAKIKSLDLWKK